MAVMDDIPEATAFRGALNFPPVSPEDTVLSQTTRPFTVPAQEVAVDFGAKDRVFTSSELLTIPEYKSITPNFGVITLNNRTVTETGTMSAEVLNSFAALHADTFNQTWDTIKTPEMSRENLEKSFRVVPNGVQNIFILDGKIIGGFSLNASLYPIQTVQGVGDCIRKIISFKENIPDAKELQARFDQRVTNIIDDSIAVVLEDRHRGLINADELVTSNETIRGILQTFETNLWNEIQNIEIAALEAEPSTRNKFYADLARSMHALGAIDGSGKLDEKVKSDAIYRFVISSVIGGSIAEMQDLMNARYAERNTVPPKEYDAIFWTSRSIRKSNLAAMFDSIDTLKYFGRPITRPLARNVLRMATHRANLHFPKRIQQMIDDFTVHTARLFDGYIIPDRYSKEKGFLTGSSTADTNILMGKVPINALQIALSNPLVYNMARFANPNGWELMISTYNFLEEH